MDCCLDDTKAGALTYESEPETGTCAATDDCNNLAGDCCPTTDGTFLACACYNLMESAFSMSIFFSQTLFVCSQVVEEKPTRARITKSVPNSDWKEPVVRPMTTSTYVAANGTLPRPDLTPVASARKANFAPTMTATLMLVAAMI